MQMDETPEEAMRMAAEDTNEDVRIVAENPQKNLHQGVSP